MVANRHRPNNSRQRRDAAKQHTQPASSLSLTGTADPVVLQEAIEHPHQADPATIISLQRSYGNQFVQRLMEGNHPRAQEMGVQRSLVIQRWSLKEWLTPKSIKEGEQWRDMADPFRFYRDTKYGDQSKATEAKKARDLLAAKNTVNNTDDVLYDRGERGQGTEFEIDQALGLTSGFDPYSYHNDDPAVDNKNRSEVSGFWGKALKPMGAVLLNPLGGLVKGGIKGGELGYKELGKKLVYDSETGTGGAVGLTKRVGNWTAQGWKDLTGANKTKGQRAKGFFQMLAGGLGTLVSGGVLTPLAALGTGLLGTGATVLGAGAGTAMSVAGSVAGVGRAGFKGVRALTGSKAATGLNAMGAPIAMAYPALTVLKTPTEAMGAFDKDKDGLIGSEQGLQIGGVALSGIGTVANPLNTGMQIAATHKARLEKKRAKAEGREVGRELASKQLKGGIKGILSGLYASGTSATSLASSIDVLKNGAAGASQTLGNVTGGLFLGLNAVNLGRNLWGMGRAINKKNKLRSTKHDIRNTVANLDQQITNQGGAGNVGQLGGPAQVDLDNLEKAKDLHLIAKYAQGKKNKTAWLKGLGAGGAALGIAAGAVALAGLGATPVGWGLAAGAAAVGLGIAGYKAISGIHKKRKRLQGVRKMRNELDLETYQQRTANPLATLKDMEAAIKAKDPNAQGLKYRGKGWAFKQMFVYNSSEKRGKRTEERIQDQGARNAGAPGANLLEQRVHHQNDMAAAVPSIPAQQTAERLKRLREGGDTLGSKRWGYKSKKSLMADKLVAHLLDQNAPTHQYAKDVAKHLGVLDHNDNLKKSTGLWGFWTNDKDAPQTNLNDLLTAISAPVGGANTAENRAKAMKEKEALSALFKRKLGSG